MNKERTLIINDVTAYGRVSTMAMLPIFTKYGIHAYTLPTALLSNATDYDSPVILDTTEFMQSAICKWKELGFGFDNICVGFINSAEQMDIIKSMIEDQSPSFVLVDPIMADSGKLYDGIFDGVIESNRKLASYADLLIPNLTEAEMLTGMYIGKSILTDYEIEALTYSLANLCKNDIIITSCKSSNGQTYNIVYTSNNNKIEKVFYDVIDGHYVGTGDIFSAIVFSEYKMGSDLKAAVIKADSFIHSLLLNKNNTEDPFDLLIEANINCI